MPKPLTAARLSILKAHSEAGDRIAYYSQLDAWGYAYAGLALGVVNAEHACARKSGV